MILSSVSVATSTETSAFRQLLQGGFNLHLAARTVIPPTCICWVFGEVFGHGGWLQRKGCQCSSEFSKRMKVYSYSQ